MEKEKKRKHNFNSAEMEKMLAALTKYDAALYGAQHKNTTKAQRREILEACALRLTPEEEIIARCLSQEQLEGVPGYDSTDRDLGTGKCVLSPIRCVA